MINLKNRMELKYVTIGRGKFKIIFNEIKSQISNTQVEIFQNANMSLLKLYYNIGKIICDNSRWGNKFIDELSIELKISFPNIKGFSVRDLKSIKNII